METIAVTHSLSHAIHAVENFFFFRSVYYIHTKTNFLSHGWRPVQMWRNHDFAFSIFNISMEQGQIKVKFSDYISQAAVHILKVSLDSKLPWQFYNWNTGPWRNYPKWTCTLIRAQRIEKLSETRIAKKKLSLDKL